MNKLVFLVVFREFNVVAVTFFGVARVLGLRG